MTNEKLLRPTILAATVLAIFGIAASIGRNGHSGPTRTDVVPAEGARPSGGPVRVGIVDLQPAEPRDDELDALVGQERLGEALDRAVSSLRSSAERLGPVHPETLLRLQRLGAVAFQAGDMRTAEEALDAVLGARRRSADPHDPRVAETLILRGYAARYKQDRALARRCYDEAWTILGALGPEWDPLRANLEQAEADWIRAADWNAAMAWYRRAHERRVRAIAYPSFPDADNLTWLGWTLAQGGRFEDAKPVLLQAREQFRALGLASQTRNATIDHALADIATAEGRSREAEPLFRSAASIFEAARGRYFAGFARRACPLDGFDALAAAALSRGEFEEAWRLMERSRGAVFVDFAALGVWKLDAPETFQLRQRLRGELLNAKRLLGAPRASGEGGWDKDRWSLLLRSFELRSEINRLESDYLAAHRPREITIDAARKLLGPRTALIGWLDVSITGDRRMRPEPWRSTGWGYVLRHNGPIVWIPLWNEGGPHSAALGRTWEPIHRASTWPLRVGPDPDAVNRLRAWSRMFVDPLLPYLDGIDHLVVENNNFPVDTLVAPDGRFLVDRFETIYTPSILGSSILDRRPSPRTKIDSAVSIAGPSLNTRLETIDALTRSTDDTVDLRRLRSHFPREGTPLDRIPKLRYAGMEASAVAAFFPRASILRDDPDLEHRLWEAATDGRIGGAGLVHIAAHTLTDVSSERCGLMLSDRPSHEDLDDDGVLELEEIFLGWDITASLVTLSGCETARAAGADRGEVLGFAQVMLSAGARNVLSSFWPVDDRATTILMNRFYENLTGRYADTRSGRSGEPMPQARALREAKLYLRGIVDARGDHPFEHPVYWAGFILMGVPGRE